MVATVALKEGSQWWPRWRGMRRFQGAAQRGVEVVVAKEGHGGGHTGVGVMAKSWVVAVGVGEEVLGWCSQCWPRRNEVGGCGGLRVVAVAKEESQQWPWRRR